MAQISVQQFKKVDKQRNNVHEKVVGTYTVFEEDGDKFFQIDTYGRVDRVIPEKISQSIQIDSKMAKYLVNLLMKEFNI